MGRPRSTTATMTAAAEKSTSATTTSSSSWIDACMDDEASHAIAANYCAFFGCDEPCSIATLPTGHLLLLHRQSASPRNSTTTHGRHAHPTGDATAAHHWLDDDRSSEFAARHDSFLDALLHEQQQKALHSSSAPVSSRTNNNNTNAGTADESAAAAAAAAAAILLLSGKSQDEDDASEPGLLSWSASASTDSNRSSPAFSLWGTTLSPTASMMTSSSSVASENHTNNTNNSIIITNSSSMSSRKRRRGLLPLRPSPLDTPLLLLRRRRGQPRANTVTATGVATASPVAPNTTGTPLAAAAASCNNNTAVAAGGDAKTAVAVTGTAPLDQQQQQQKSQSPLFGNVIPLVRRLSHGGNAASSGPTKTIQAPLQATTTAAAAAAPATRTNTSENAAANGTTTFTTTPYITTPNELLLPTTALFTNALSPERFLHAHVRLQKDKQKGDELGSNVCAQGIPLCLEKLRAKMLLLTEHCQGAATMQRRNAIGVVGVVSGPTTTSVGYNTNATNNTTSSAIFVETRSLLILRMGFMSMTYGILLRWDVEDTGLATLVVLRKNCPESFYSSHSNTNNNNTRALASSHSRPPTTASVPWNSSSSGTARNTNARTAAAAACCTSPPMTISPTTSMDDEENQFLEDDSLSYAGSVDGTSNPNASLWPPFITTRPSMFEPPQVTVTVLSATGLKKQLHKTSSQYQQQQHQLPWTVQLQLAEQTKSIVLVNDDNDTLGKGNRMVPQLDREVGPLIFVIQRMKMPSSSSSPPSSSSLLHIRMLEHKHRRKSLVLRYSMSLPLTALEAGNATSMKVPCPDGSNASIQLQLQLDCEQTQWERQERCARQAQQQQLHHRRRRKTPPANQRSTAVKKEVDEEDAPSPWDWMCMLC